MNVGLSPKTNEISGLFRRQTHSRCARSFAPCSHIYMYMYNTKFAITCIHVRMANPVRTGFKPPREVDWLNAHSIRIGSMRIQCGRNQCALNAHSMSSVDRPYLYHYNQPQLIVPVPPCTIKPCSHGHLYPDRIRIDLVHI